MSSLNICLLVLPTPRTCFGFAHDCLTSCKLLLCGDVETSPGPTTGEMFQQLLSVQSVIQKELEELNKTAADD